MKRINVLDKYLWFTVNEWPPGNRFARCITGLTGGEIP